MTWATIQEDSLLSDSLSIGVYLESSYSSSSSSSSSSSPSSSRSAATCDQPGRSPQTRQPVPPASGSQFPKPEIPTQRSQAKDPQPKIQSPISQANDPKPKIQSLRSQANDLKPAIQSQSQRSKAKPKMLSCCCIKIARTEVAKLKFPHEKNKQLIYYTTTWLLISSNTLNKLPLPIELVQDDGRIADGGDVAERGRIADGMAGGHSTLGEYLG